MEKELRHISVRELTDKAKVHRVTFYKHYYDVNELYDQLENEVLTELGLLFMKFYENPSKSFGKELMDYIAQNPKIFKMIFTPNNTGTLRQKLSKLVEGVFLLIQAEKKTTDRKDIRLNDVSTFWANGCLAVLEKWVLTDFAQPQAVVIETIAQLDTCLETYIGSQLA